MKSKVLSNLASNTDLAVGRFAPSPTGVLHLGSLMAAVASYLNVKSVGGRWLIRIDDIDTPRVVVGSADHILQTLDSFGFEWDALIWQSQRHAHYQEAIAHLQTQQLIYSCGCSRAMILQRLGSSGGYDNYCRPQSNAKCDVAEMTKGKALRVVSPTSVQIYQDVIQDSYQLDWARLGDVMLRRSDGFWSYHLACAVDDADFGITQVVRGSDLLLSTPMQTYVQEALGLQSPLYAHYPLLLSAKGIKLSKASNAPAIDLSHPSSTLYQVLDLLGQTPPKTLLEENLTTCWQWAIQHWQLAKVPKLSAIALE